MTYQIFEERVYEPADSLLTLLGSALLYRLDRDPEASRFEDRLEAPQLRIARLRQHLVGGFARELRLSCDLGDAALRLGNLP